MLKLVEFKRFEIEFAVQMLLGVAPFWTKNRSLALFQESSELCWRMRPIFHLKILKISDWSEKINVIHLANESSGAAQNSVRFQSQSALPRNQRFRQLLASKAKWIDYTMLWMRLGEKQTWASDRWYGKSHDSEHQRPWLVVNPSNFQKNLASNFLYCRSKFRDSIECVLVLKTPRVVELFQTGKRALRFERL